MLTIKFVYLLVFAFLLTISSQPAKVAAAKQTLWGISYSPNTKAQWCPTQAVVNKDIAMFKKAGIMHLRMYSQGCNILEFVLNAIKGSSMQVLTGVWLTASASDYDVEISQLLKTLKATPSSVISKNLIGVIVGNEVINAGVMTEKQLINTIKDAREKLKTAGFGGVKLTTAEVPGRYSKNIINAVNFLTPNVHIFWSNVTASNGYPALDYWVKYFRAQSKKELYIGETGWPTAGKVNGPAMPSTANQMSYAKQVACKGAKEKVKYFWFEALDATWKSGGPWDIEQHWGLWTPERKLKSFTPKFSC